MTPLNPILVRINGTYGVVARLGDDNVVMAVPTAKMPNGSQFDAATWLIAEMHRDAELTTLADFKGTTPTNMRYTWIRLDDIWVRRIKRLGISRATVVEMTLVGKETQEEVALVFGRAPKPDSLRVTGTKVSKRLRELLPERIIG